MATVVELAQPKLFLQSALANVNAAHWYVWEHGICVGYWDDSDTHASLLCWWRTLGRGFRFQAEKILDVAVSGHQILIASSAGFSRWDGQTLLETIDAPIGNWQKVQIEKWGAVGFHDFGYQRWNIDSNTVERLPMGVQKVWKLSDDGLLWSHWGQFFQANSEGVKALEPLRDTMDYCLALSTGWWVAVYDTSIVVVHTKRTTKRFDNSDIMDVIVRTGQKSILILLATGLVLEWNPEVDSMPCEIGETDGELFIGDDLVYVDGDVEYLFS